MTNPTTITLPRLPNERAERYEARTAYILMGADRSLRDVAQKLDKSLTIVGRWSSEDNWPDLAAQHDQTVYTLAAQQHTARHIAELEAHREKAMTSAKNLLALANGLTRIMGDALTQPRTIEGKDGKFYTLHKVVADTSTLATISRALTAALDIEAHALGVSTLLAGRDESQ